MVAPCPSCQRPRDAKGRCWHCCDAACQTCGCATGSAFIGWCILCQAAAGASEDEVRTKSALPSSGTLEAPAADRWVLVLEAEPGPVPVAVRVRHVLKYARRQQGLRCVALPNVIPSGTRTDEVFEGEWT